MRMKSFPLRSLLLTIGVCLASWLPASADTGAVTRIVSLAPSITEIVFDIGAGDRLVGVTRYCKFPPAADSIAEVGGFIDPNLEAIMALKPDVVLHLAEAQSTARRLADAGLLTVGVNHRTLVGALESYEIIGRAVGREKSAKRRSRELALALENILLRAGGPNPPKVLMSIGHGDEPGALRSVTVAGDEQYYSEMIRVAGGVNVIRESAVRYPELSPEGLLALDPDVIIDIFYADSVSVKEQTRILAQWASVGPLSAIKHNRVYVLAGNHLVIPGSRIIRAIEDFSRVIRPSAWRNEQR